MKKQEVRFQADKNLQKNTIDLYVAMFSLGSDKIQLGQPVVMEEVSMEHQPNVPTLSIPRDDAQNLMDELWAVGLRPSHEATLGQLEAQKNHLNDMRKLVEKAYDVQLGAQK